MAEFREDIAWEKTSTAARLEHEAYAENSTRALAELAIDAHDAAHREWLSIFIDSGETDHRAAFMADAHETALDNIASWIKEGMPR